MPLCYDEKGNFVEYQDSLGHTTLSDYDDNNNLTGIVLPDGNTSSYSYDTKGNLVGLTDQLQQITRFGYGDYSRLTYFSDAEESTTQYSYDTSGNNTARTSPDLTEQTYAYNATGEVVQRNNRRGVPIYIARDAQGQVTRIDYNDGSHVAYTYDAVGNILSAEDETGTTTMTYTANHLLSSITYPGGRFLEYTYDSAGRRSSMRDQTGYQLNYDYNLDGELQRIIASSGEILAQYTYDSLGRLTQSTLGNGVTTAYQYDLAGRILDIVSKKPDNSVISSYTYTYDANNRRTSVTSIDGVWNYTYDATGQLTQAVFTSSNGDIPSKEITYVYDKVGNRVQEIVNGVSASYSVNNMNQYTQAGTFSYSYDLDGNLIEKSDGTNTWTYEYNDNNRLIRATGPVGVSEYIYNGLGQLATVTENGVARHYMVDPVGFGNVVGEYDASGTLLSRYNHGLGLISKDGDYYTFDANGNTSEMTDTAAEIVNYYVYEPFGKALHKVETEENDFGFVGQFGVMEMGDDLIYMRNRFYAPSLGRFMAEDPTGLAGGDVSFYRYVQNDPVNFIDPMGLWLEGPHKSGWFKKLQKVERKAMDIAFRKVTGLPGTLGPKSLGLLLRGTGGALVWELTHPTTLGDGTLPPNWDKQPDGESEQPTQPNEAPDIPESLPENPDNPC